MKITRVVKTAGTQQEIEQLKAELLNKKYANNNPYGAIINSALEQRLKEKLKELESTTTVAVVETGKHYYEFSIDSDISDSEIIEEVKASIKESREKAKQVEKKKLNYNGIQYELVGGVFSKQGEVLAIKSSINRVSRAAVYKSPHEKIKDNYVGFEIEYISKADGTKTKRDFADASLDGFVTCKGDGSLRADNDGEYCHEVTVLCKQSEAVSIMAKVLAVIKSHKGYVNNSCGGHIHLDARNSDPKLMYSNLVAGLPLLNKLIPKKRVDNRFCRTNSDRGYDYYASGEGASSKYWAINPQTYDRIKTIEVRMHGGTLSLSKWINWMKICATLAYSKKNLASVTSMEHFSELYSGADKADLMAFIEKRMHLIEKTADELDTRTDHFLDIYNSIA